MTPGRWPILLMKSQRGALLGELQAPPRVNIAPPPTRANSWEDVADLSASFGLVLDPWQELVFQSAMGERSNGTWAAQRVGLSAPRQNGKSQLIVARALAGALLFGEKKIVISAHQQDTARETFGKFIELIDDSPALAGRIRQVMNALNREFIKFTNGAVIQFKARSSGGTRGFSCDCLMLDEAQILGRRAWASINSTMSARPNPQVWLMGTPPTPEDDGAVFASVRKAAIDGVSTQAAYLEWSAEPTDDPALPATRAKANPAWHVRINHDVVQGEFETYTREQFALERLGIWAEVGKADGVISSEAWAACRSDLAISSAPAVALDVSPMLTFSGIVAAGLVGDGRMGVEVTSDGADLVDFREGTGWAVDLLTSRSAEVWIVAGSAAETLQTRLESGGCRVHVMDRAEYAKACVNFAALVADRGLVHRGQPELDRQVVAGVKRTADEGLWTWGRVKSSADIPLLVAATVAVQAASIHATYDVMASGY